MNRQLQSIRALFCSFCLLITVVPLYAQSVNHVWSKNAGGTNSTAGVSIAVDASGNSYTAGRFSGVTDFDPGPGVLNLSSVGGTSINGADVFVMKLDATGNLVWAKSVGGTGLDYPKSIALDGSGNIFVAGNFSGTVDFDPGPAVYNVTANGTTNTRDMFVMKLDPTGGFVWVKTWGNSGTAGSEELTSMSLDLNGNIYTTGAFMGNNVDFDPGNGTSLLTVAGGSDVFILKLDPAGNFLWAKNIDGSGYESGNAISTDGLGNVVLTGTFDGTVDFDPGSAVANLTAAMGNDIFVAKYDASGNFVWAKHFSGYGDAKAICADASGNIYTTGGFGLTVDFDPGSAVYNLNGSQVSFDVFISKLDASGNFVWAKGIGNDVENFGTAIAVDAGNVYVSGYFGGIMDSDPGVNTFNLEAHPTNLNSNAFMLKLDLSGNFIWARNTAKTSLNASEGRAITLDGSGNIYATGSFGGTADFDPGFNQVNLTVTTTNQSDVYVQKLSQNICGVPTYTNVVFTGCDSFSFAGTTYYSAGLFPHVLTNSGGCDSIVNLNLTINNSTPTNFSSTVCDSFIFNGQTLLTSGVYIDTFTNALGCDSIVTLNLTIKHSSNLTITQVACDSFMFNGQTYMTSGTYFDTLVNQVLCDSFITLNLQVNHSIATSFTQSACDSFNWNGTTYLISGVYQDTLATIDGCDSIVTMNLTINTVDVSVTKNAATITASAAGASYQWVDCGNGYANITGETGQSFTATHNGNYAVIVTQNGCTDTSECKSVTHLIDNVDNLSLEEYVKIYPNPTSGFLNIKTISPLRNATLKVRNKLGQIVFERSGLYGLGFHCDLTGFATGVYLLEITDGVMVRMFKVVKE